ncbi:MAG: hypothetical protein ACJ8GW_19920 [Massilia sp.]
MMSLSEPFGLRTVCVQLGPDLLSAEVRSGARVVAHSEMRLAASGADGGRSAALEALRNYLAQAGITLRGAPLALAIDARWCEITMLPWSDALMYDAGARRYCDAWFAARFGAAAHGRSISCDDAPVGAPRLACGVAREFLDALRHIAVQSGHPCVVIAPNLLLAPRPTLPAAQAGAAYAPFEAPPQMPLAAGHGTMSWVLTAP